MAIEKVVNLKVTDGFYETTEKVKALTEELRKAKEVSDDLSLAYGKSSDKAIEAAQKVNEITANLEAAKGAMDSFNPSDKLDSLSNSLDSVSSGYEAVFDGITRVTDSASKIKEVSESVKSLKEVSEILKGANLVRKFYNALIGESTAATAQNVVATEGQAVATGAATAATGGLSVSMKALRVAIITSGIGVLVIALGYLIEKMSESKQATEEAKRAQELLSDAIDRVTESYKRQRDELDQFNESQKLRAEIAGKSAKEILDLEISASDQKIELIKAERQALLDKQTDENLSLEQSVKNNKRILELSNEVTSELHNQEVMRLSFERDIANQKRTEAKQAEEKRLADLKKALEDRLNKERENYKQLLEELRAFNAKVAQADSDRFDQQFADQREKDEYLKSLFGQSAEQLLEAEYEKGRKILDAGNATGEERLRFESEFIDRRNQLVLDKEKAAADESLRIAQTLADQKQEIREQEFGLASNFANLLQQLAGKNKAIAKTAVIVEKAASIAQTITSTVAANAKAVAASPLTGGQPWVGINTASASIGIASAIVATTKALQEIGAGGSGGSAPGVPSGSGQGQSTAPQFNIVGQSTSTNQIAQSIANRETNPQRAYVLSTEVTTNQAMDRQIRQIATFN